MTDNIIQPSREKNGSVMGMNITELKDKFFCSMLVLQKFHSKPPFRIKLVKKI
jgi:hypothetical protein